MLARKKSIILTVDMLEPFGFTFAAQFAGYAPDFDPAL